MINQQMKRLKAISDSIRKSQYQLEVALDCDSWDKTHERITELQEKCTAFQNLLKEIDDKEFAKYNIL